MVFSSIFGDVIEPSIVKEEVADSARSLSSTNRNFLLEFVFEEILWLKLKRFLSASDESPNCILALLRRCSFKVGCRRAFLLKELQLELSEMVSIRAKLSLLSYNAGSSRSKLSRSIGLFCVCELNDRLLFIFWWAKDKFLFVDTQQKNLFTSYKNPRLSRFPDKKSFDEDL